MTALTVINTSIRLHDGLYSLNDLHKAAGHEKKHQPALFLRTDQTKALIEEIECSTDMQITPIKTIRGNRADGTPQGTYACKELVYAYAMWISAKFHLEVIRAFDAMVTGNRPGTCDGGNPFDRVNPRILSELRRLAPKAAIEYLIGCGVPREYFRPAQASKPVAARMSSRQSVDDDVVPPDRLISGIPELADWQDANYWYLLRQSFERICAGRDVTATARHIRDRGYLKCGKWSLMWRAPRGFCKKRSSVFAISKKIAELNTDGGRHAA